MIFNKCASKILLTSTIVIFALVGCNSESRNDEIIIAKINNKSISLNEFLRRSEYTIRPSYCKNNSNVDKQIILNSLIAEKLLSIEAEKKGFAVDKKKDIQLYLLGRKEQAMRQILYNNEVTEKVKIDSSSINKYLKFANRIFDLSYISITDSMVLTQLNEELNVLKLDFDTLLTESYGLKEIPKKVVKFVNHENKMIINTLYNEDRKKGEVIGPIQVDKERQMFLKINGWTDTPVITNEQIIGRHKKVQEFLELTESKRIYKKMIQKVMEDKKIDFNRKVFFRFTDILAPIYLKSKKEKEKLFFKGVLENSIEKEKYKNSFEELKNFKNDIIFSESGNDWTIGELMVELKKHPLTFRYNSIANNEFGFQLQLAIIDLVRDHYLTEAAYEQNIDNNPNIIRNTNMWKDNLNAINFKYSYLEQNKIDSLFNKDHMFVLDKYLNGFVDSLQNKYSDSIFINVKEFNKINITRIQMSGTYVNAPFKTIVPNFPVITTSSRLDYGSNVKE